MKVRQYVGERGFILLIGLLITAVIIAVLLASYSGYLGKSVERIPNIGGPDKESSGFWRGQTVVYEIRDNKTGEVERGSFGLLPLDVFDYRLRMTDTDYKTYAVILVENVSAGVYKNVKLGKGDSERVGEITITVVNFINSPCPVGVEC